MKKGITVVTISIMIVVIAILAGTITIGAYNSIQNGKKLVFSLEISNIQEELDSYEGTETEPYPIKGNTYTIDLTNVSTNSISQFDGEVKNGNEITLYEIDLSLLGIDDTEYGNKQTEKDVYVVSIDTGRVYYLEGLKYGSKTYYTLTQDLIDIKERNEKEEGTETTDEAPVITTTAFSVKTTDSGNDIYLSNIKVEGENVTKIKYEKAIIEETEAKEYFKNNGYTINSDRIKVNEGDYITLYAESSSGEYSVRLEGIPEIPDEFYYVGGSIPTGVVISDSSQDANKGTATDGDVVSEGLAGNQFVWVPVVDMSEFVRRDGYYNEALQTMVSSGEATEPFSKTTSGGITLSATNDLTGEYAEYAKMKASVEKYGGFYIARYEAGTTEERTNVANGTSFKADGTTPDILSQKDKYAYNYVGWGPNTTTISGDVTWDSKNQGKGAVELARSIYPESSDKEVVSTLIYGAQWDAVMNFMKDIENPNVEGKKYIEDSTSMGWYSDNYLSGNAEYKTGIDVDKKASNKVKNIYDTAGNVWEWTMEAISADYRVFRGSNYNYDGASNPASTRNGSDSSRAIVGYGFRVALYIK